MSDMRGPDDVSGDRLREVLARSVSTVDPAEGSLGSVLDRAHRQSRWTWGGPVLAAAAALVVVAVVVGLVAVARPSGHDVAAGPTSTGTHPTASSPAPSATGTGASSSPTQGTGALRALPVYYAAVPAGQAVLYREFHRVRTTDPAPDALRQLLGTKAADPDYESLWPQGTTLVSYALHGSVADVALSVAPERFTIVAFQQIVYTVTAADPRVTAVRISYGSVTRDPIVRGNPATYLAPIWVLTPLQGSTSRSPVTLSGQATVFEATVGWEVDRTNGTKVAGGHTMATIGAPGRGPWSVRVSLPPGDYVVKAYEVSMQTGLWMWTDTKDFTVR